jgi:hypothetical protein
MASSLPAPAVDRPARRCRRRAGRALAAALAVLWPGLPLAAGEPPVSYQDIEGAEEVIEATKRIGPWESQYQVMEEATDRVFERQGWTSEPDRFARDLMRQVGQIAPWKPEEREKAFMEGLQGRYHLTHDQRSRLGTDMRRETMLLTLKHFKDIVPVAMEIARTRAAGQPFSSDQVQQWSRALRPMMEDGLQLIERVTGRLQRTMSEDQRRLLDADLQAFRRRHADVRRLVDRWEAGQWSPADWGLDTDPVHAGVMARQAAAEGRSAAPAAPRPPDETATAAREDAWDAYVRWFCNAYQCDDRQRTSADRILKNSKKEAYDYRSARRDLIARAERLAGQGTGSPQQKAAAAELQRVLAPITQIFERMKKRLHAEVLTTRQRLMFAPEDTASAPPRAAPAPAPPPSPQAARPPD